MPPPIIKRLTKQLAAKGEEDPERMAYALQNKAGNLKGTELTAKGARRQALGAAGRAKDRAAKAAGGDPRDYAYDPASNRARKR